MDESRHDSTFTDNSIYDCIVNNTINDTVDGIYDPTVENTVNNITNGIRDSTVNNTDNDIGIEKIIINNNNNLEDQNNNSASNNHHEHSNDDKFLRESNHTRDSGIFEDKYLYHNFPNFPHLQYIQ